MDRHGQTLLQRIIERLRDTGLRRAAAVSLWLWTLSCLGFFTPLPTAAEEGPRRPAAAESPAVIEEAPDSPPAPTSDDEADLAAAPANDAEADLAPEPIAAEEADLAPEPTVAEETNLALDYRRQVDQLVLELAAETRTRKDVDTLFIELNGKLWPMCDRVHQAIHDDAFDLIDRHDALTTLYEQRGRLFRLLSPRFARQLTGIDELGRNELDHEFSFMLLNLEYQTAILREATRHLSEAAVESPFALLQGLIQLFVSVMALRLWRRWAKKGIPELRTRLISNRNRTRGALRFARFLWYVDRIRRPIEWLILATIFMRVIRPPGFEEITFLVQAIIFWVLVATFAVLMIEAMAARSAGGLRASRSALRLKTLRVAAGWGVLLGLGLDVAAHYAGTGAIYAWIVRGWMMLTVPVALLLVRWWRPVIFDRLDEIADHSAWAARLGQSRSGAWSFFAAAAGVAVLLGEATLRFIVRRLSNWDFGRRILAVLVRREVTRDTGVGERLGEEKIADEIILPLIAARDVHVDGIAKAQRDQLIEALERHSGGASAVLGERGSGKTIFLARLVEHFGESIRVLDCPTGGYDRLEALLAESFGIEQGEGIAERLASAVQAAGVRILAIDDFHLLPRPRLGGQEDLMRLARLIEPMGSRVSFVFALDRHAWRYMILARGEQALLHETVELQPWTEEQIAEMVEARARSIGIEPDYGKLVLPRQLDAGEHEDADDRNRYGYARILWELADGNPEVSLYLFAESLRRLKDGSVILRLPRPVSPNALVDAHPEALLVLRVLVQCDVATVADLSESLRLPRDRILTLLRFCVQSEWVSEVEGAYRVSWRWFRTITRGLARQNLMTR